MQIEMTIVERLVVKIDAETDNRVQCLVIAMKRHGKRTIVSPEMMMVIVIMITIHEIHPIFVNLLINMLTVADDMMTGMLSTTAVKELKIGVALKELTAEMMPMMKMHIVILAIDDRGHCHLLRHAQLIIAVLLPPIDYRSRMSVINMDQLLTRKLVALKVMHVLLMMTVTLIRIKLCRRRKSADDKWNNFVALYLVRKLSLLL